MFFIQTMRMMAGPYLCNLMDIYYAHQDILNLIVFILGTIWIVYKRFYKNSIAADK